MPQKKPAPRPSPQDYNSVVDAAELLDVKLIKSSFDLQPHFFAAEDQDLDFRYTCDLERSSYDAESKVLLGQIALEAGSKVGRKWVLRVRSTYVVAYSISGEPPEDAATGYLERVARFTAYPYFRAHFASLCSDAGAKVPPLPVLKGNVPTRILGDAAPEAAKLNAP